MNLRDQLEKAVCSAMAAAGVPADCPAIVAPAARAEFGDYQANGVMAAAKKLKTNPRKLAEQVVAKLNEAGCEFAEKFEVARPGFINITLAGKFLKRQLAAAAADEAKLGVQPADAPQTVVVDYSAPNLAKEMHVGHLRSTIIGDCLARVLDFLGHTVIRQNHVGDWGTQYGMLLKYLDEKSDVPVNQESIPKDGLPGDKVTIRVHKLNELEGFYREARKRFDEDADFAKSSRDYVVKLQSGDKYVRQLWEDHCRLSLQHCSEIYEKLGVLLTNDDIRGESAYNADLPKVVADLRTKGLLTESQGAQCVFLPEFKGKDGELLPFIVQKSNEGFLYATTDLAAIRFRVETLHVNRILYVVGAPQALHFKQLFAVASKAGFLPPNVKAEHIAFGSMLGQDGKLFKTRAGGTVKLMELLNEAEERALKLVSEKNPDLPDGEKKEIARTVGIGAVKYADLSQNRTSDYVFSWDKMLSLEGNTAPYMQYAYARVKSIFEKGGVASAAGEIRIAEKAERALAVKLTQFPETVQAVADDCMPNYLCAYLFDLAGAFMGFYESCPVLKSDDATRASRLALCHLTAEVIRKGLGLLGIETIERM